MNPRFKRAIQSIKKEGLDGLLLSSRHNIRYLTGFHGEDAYLLVLAKGQGIYLTDFRYLEHAKSQLKNFKICDINSMGNFAKTIAEKIKISGAKFVGFEERLLPFAEHRAISKHLKQVKLIPVAGIIEELRQIKDVREVRIIQKAIRITENAFKYLKKQRLVGKTEKQVADWLENRIRNCGAQASSFEIIVAAGANSSFPHAKSGARKIKNNSLVMIDMGVILDGYNCDLTRVLFLGKIKAKLRKIYEIVREAKSLAINKIRPGLPISEIDAAARDFITSKGYGKNFGHSLGHGVGLEVHEAPRVSGNNKDLLKEGMVFTIEPAIYLPRQFGIRLEDMVLVTKKGAKVLNDCLFD